tara:strand:+ start:988 stop:2016 length:1029 start_codon:yes stop_codon:yes gene_type:complete
MKFLKCLVLLSIILITSNLKAQDYTGVSYGTEPRQFLDIYISPSNCPTPVYFNAHPNGGTTSMPSSITDSLISNGISIISWESVPTLNNPQDVLTGWNDAEIMFNWVKANTSIYNLDTNNFIIGGSSRGTVLSWKEAYRNDPGIKGLYMYNALPSGAWGDSTFWHPPNDVTAQSPNIFFVYKREPGCSSDSINPDIHDPNYGIIIQNRYSDLGIISKDTLVHSIGNSTNTDRYQFLLEFALSVIDPCLPANIESEKSNLQRINIYPNPSNDIFNIVFNTNTKKDIDLRVHNVLGELIFSESLKDFNGNFNRSIDLSQYSSAIYILQLNTKDEILNKKLVLEK